MREKHWGSLTAASAAAVVVGFASTILVVIEAARAVGATPAQQASVAASLCFGMAISTLGLAWFHRMPIITAWSTPGAVLIATSASGITYQQAIGAYMLAGALMAATAFVKPLSRAIEKMPPAIAAALLAGVLLRYVLGVPGATLAAPVYGVPLVFAYFALRVVEPLFAVPITVLLGLMFAFIFGAVGVGSEFGITKLTFDVPLFDLPTLISLGVPLYLVTMASQNLPGFAVLRTNGYNPPVASSLAVTGLGSIILAPFGSHAINMAAITASLVAGPDSHPDPDRRWLAAFPYFVIYIVVGLGASLCVTVLGALPKEMITIIAGLALFGPLLGGMAAMTKNPAELEPALVTFLVAASGVTVAGVGAAFWGLLAGLAVWGVKRLRRSGS
jgi:benzoate membrane transport protein